MSVDSILKKAELACGLSLKDSVYLLNHIDHETMSSALELASRVKLRIKGDLVSFYTCLYITNSCMNDCGYCGYRRSNSELKRITLTVDNIVKEAEAIKKSGVSNVILIGGTLPEASYSSLILKGIEILGDCELNPWIEFENLSLSTLKRAKALGAEHFVLFQETYNREKYSKIHGLCGSKKDFDNRLGVVDLAVEAGIENINIGSLFGLTTNFCYEVQELYKHATRLNNEGVNVCISLPTLKDTKKYLGVSSGDLIDNLIKAYIVFRLALPNVSLAISGREEERIRNLLFSIVDQIGTGGAVNPGGRTVHKTQYFEGDRQFSLLDNRKPREIKEYLGRIGVDVVSVVDWG